MKVLLSWLREFVDVQLPPIELAHLLTMSGSEVASVEEVGSPWSRIRIGQIGEINAHPAADKLFVARVDFGREAATLVTAATNLRAGDKVPVVLPGGRLFPDNAIQAVDFRGIRSEGMLCSGLELGINADGDGIYVMESDAPVGTDLKDYLSDFVIDLDLTPNRPDCLSVVGIAREVAALTGASLHVPETVLPTGDFDSAEKVTVEIADPDLCPRYSAVVLKGVKIGPSPLWMQRRLFLCGVRPHNNVVDVTNYVMLERGQPLHAFDGGKLRGGIIVRRARQGETITTLDGDLRRLAPDNLVIADHVEPVAIAGVMGGLDSEVDDSTELVVLESANFDRGSIRRTVRQLRLATDASKRFDKGLDPELTVPSALRAAELMVAYAGATAGRGVVDVYPGPIRPVALGVSEADVEKRLGIAFSRDEMKRIFGSLGFETRDVGESLQVIIPTFRRDIEGKADLAEELIRIKGYDQIPTTLPAGAIPDTAPEPYRYWERVARETLVGAGYQEVITYSLVDCDSAARLTVDTSPEAAKIALDMIRLENPMTPEQACLRTSLLGSLLRTIESNMRHERRAYIFEVARVYLPPLDPLPTERRTVGVAFTGPREPEAWDSRPEQGDFFDLKGAVETLLRAMGISAAAFEPGRHVSMHPGRTARLLVKGRTVGYLGEVHPTVVERYDLLPHRTFAAELDLEALMSVATTERQYEPLPRFPAVTHDIAVVLDDSWANDSVEQEITRTGAPLLADVTLFDVYRGAPIPAGKKSLAYSLSYRAPDRTLTDEEVMAVEARVIESLNARFDAYLRGR